MEKKRVALALLAFLLVSCSVPNNAPTPIPTLHGPSPTSTPADPVPTETPTNFFDVEIPAPSLANNRIGEASTRSVYVYLPPSYYTSSNRYPVIYLLPGFADRNVWGLNLPTDVDALIESGAMREMIIVVASGVNRLNGSFYVNSPITGNWEDFIAEDLIGFVDSHYRTLANRDSRGIGGHSMGGFGALNIAMHRPEVFGAVYSMSAGLFAPDGLAESQIFATDEQIRLFVDFVEEFNSIPTGDYTTQLQQSPDIFALAYGLAFAPDESAPSGFAYPYSLVDNELVRDETVWARWESGFGNVDAEIEEYKDNLLALNRIGFDVGTYDSYAWIVSGNVYFDEALTSAGIPHQFLTYDGTHISQINQRLQEFLFPFFSEILVFE